jgi:hypothetical protein
VFEETLSGFKTANLKGLGNLGASLGSVFVGLKRVDISKKILSHFEAHPKLKNVA